MAVNPNTPPSASSRLDRRFDTLRSKVEQDANAQNQQQQEAMQRRAAATGMGGSGAFTKLGAKVAQEGEKMKQNALMDVEGQREGAQAQLDEQNAQREFARAERLGSQDFAKGERLGSQDFATRQQAEQMKFARSERLGSQAFQSSEAAAQRGFSKQLFDREMDFKNRVQDAAEAQFFHNLERVDRQFWEDNRVNDFNMNMANKMFNKKDMFQGIGGLWDSNIAKPAGKVWSGG